MQRQRAPLTPLNPNSIRRKELSQIQRAKIHGASAFGHKPTEIARVLNHPLSTVKDTLNKTDSNNDYVTTPRPGRPRKYTPQDERYILRIVRREPKITYRQLVTDTQIQLSRSTLYRLLKRVGIKNWLAQKRPKLTEEHARLRLQFAHKYKHLTTKEWAQFIFSDECSIERGSGKQRVWVFRTPYQKWLKEMIQTFDKGKGISVMVWGAIFSSCERSELVIMERDMASAKQGYSANSYLQTLEEGLLDITQDEDFLELIFMQDNARIHTAKKVLIWLEEQGINLLEDWPPYSPDLNPIEHLWFALKNAVYDVCPKFDSIKGNNNIRAKLEEVLPQAWRLIKTETIRGVYESMPRRMEAVIEAEGWHTRY